MFIFGWYIGFWLSEYNCSLCVTTYDYPAFALYVAYWKFRFMVRNYNV